MKLNVSKTSVIYFTKKTNMIAFEYRLCASRITRTATTRIWEGVFLDSKLNFHQHVYYIFSQTLKLLALIHGITFSFSSIDSLLMFYFSLVRSKHECTFVT
jgi:hypothetical protein